MRWLPILPKLIQEKVVKNIYLTRLLGAAIFVIISWAYYSLKIEPDLLRRNGELVYPDQLAVYQRDSPKKTIKLEGAVTSIFSKQYHYLPTLSELIAEADGLSEKSIDLSYLQTDNFIDSEIIYIPDKRQWQIALQNNYLTGAFFWQDNIFKKALQKRTPKVKKSYNINKVSLAELIKIRGLGKKLAIKIIEYRKINKIENLDELPLILGINSKKWHKIRPYFYIKS